MGEATAAVSLSGLTVIERDDGLFAVRGPVGTHRFVINATEKALLDHLCDEISPAEALARHHAQGNPPAFNEMLHLEATLRQAGLLDPAPPPLRPGLTWQHPMSAPWLLVVMLLSLGSLVYGVGDVLLHESALLATPDHLARHCLLALAAVAMSSSLAAVLRAGLYASRGLGPQRLFISLAGCIPHVTVDDTEVLGLGRPERRLALLASALAPGLGVGLFASLGQHDAAFFSAAAWFAALQPLRGGPLALLLGEFLRDHDVLDRARHYHKRLLAKEGGADSEAALVASLTAVLLWVGGLLWIVARVADHWPAVTDFSADTTEGTLNMVLSIVLMALAATITLSTLAFLVRLLVEGLGPVSPSRPRPRAIPAGDVRQALRSAALRTGPLRDLDGQDLERLAPHCRLACYSPGNVMQQRGRAPSFVQVVLDGEATVVIEHDWGLQEPGHLLHPGDFVGEAALEGSETSADTVRACTAVRVLLVPPDPLRGLLEERTILDEVRAVLRMARRMRHTPLLGQAAPRSLYELAAVGQRLTSPAGTPVVREGDKGDRFYLIEGGRVDVTMGGRSVKILGEGDFFGEIALLADIPRVATVTPLEECHLRAVSRSDFWAVLSRDPQLGSLVEAAAARRYQP